MSTTPDLTIVLPCYNEGATITRSLATLESWFGVEPDVLVVDDGSTDDTVEQVRAYARAHPNVRVHHLPHNGGKGEAVQAAAPLAQGRYVLIIDADLAYDRESVERVLARLPSADVVVGNRRHDGSRYSVPVRLFGFLYRRHLIGLAFNACLRAVLPIQLRDTQCGLKAFRRDALAQIAPCLTIRRFAFDVDLLLVARGLGLTVADEPVRVTYDSARSSVSLLQNAIVVSWDLVRMVARRAAGRYAPDRLRAIAATAERRAPAPPPAG